MIADLFYKTWQRRVNKTPVVRVISIDYDGEARKTWLMRAGEKYLIKKIIGWVVAYPDGTIDPKLFTYIQAWIPLHGTRATTLEELK